MGWAACADTFLCLGEQCAIGKLSFWPWLTSLIPTTLYLLVCFIYFLESSKVIQLLLCLMGKHHTTAPGLHHWFRTFLLSRSNGCLSLIGRTKHGSRSVDVDLNNGGTLCSELDPCLGPELEVHYWSQLWWFWWHLILCFHPFLFSVPTTCLENLRPTLRLVEVKQRASCINEYNNAALDVAMIILFQCFMLYVGSVIVSVRFCKCIYPSIQFCC